MRGADRRKVRIVMRFRNNAVLSNRYGVLTVILDALPLTPPSPRSASLRRERE